MPACPRRQIIAANEVGIYHCYNRCVRRAFLCGSDPASGKNFDHRKEWIQLRLELLAVSFGIEICDFALMDNHIHLILRTRPEIVAAWQDHEVALRWWKICPTRRNEHGEAAPDPFPCELNQWLDDPAQMIELRSRLSSISWFMRLLCQKIARMANDEDRQSGKFWEARFKAQPLLDEQAVLTCSMYVNLNPIRVGKAETPEQSRFTSVYERIVSLKRARIAAGSKSEQNETPPTEPAECELWICKLQLADRFSEPELTEVGTGLVPAQVNPFPSRRLTNKGYLPMSEEHYLSLLDWTGRQIRSDKRGSIPSELAPIRDRLGLNASKLPDVVSGFARQFHSAVGRVDSMIEFAQRLGHRWVAGVRQSATAFTR